MATKEEVNAIVKRFYESRPPMAKIDKENWGIGMVLRHLATASAPVSAADISRFMNVSTARVAVLLRTLQEKELIVKQDDAADARKILVSLSEKGKSHIENMKKERMEMMTEVIDKIGVERMNLFLDIIEEINAVISDKFASKKES